MNIHRGAKQYHTHTQYTVVSAILFYIAKKRQWEIRKSIRKSTRRLTSNLGAAAGRAGQRRQTGLHKLADPVDTTPAPRKDYGLNRDLEKGNVTTTTTTVAVPKVASPEAMARKPATYPVPGFGKKYGR